MKSTWCEACRRGGHRDCDGYIPRGFDEMHDRECLCSRHDPEGEHRVRGLEKANQSINDQQEI